MSTIYKLVYFPDSPYYTYCARHSGSEPPKPTPRITNISANPLGSGGPSTIDEAFSLQGRRATVLWDFLEDIGGEITRRDEDMGRYDWVFDGISMHCGGGEVKYVVVKGTLKGSEGSTGPHGSTREDTTEGGNDEEHNHHHHHHHYE